MLPPPPTSRQSSYAYTLPLPRQPSYANRRIPSFAQSHVDTEVDEDEEDENELEERMAVEDEMSAVGGSEGRGLEETLEKLGFGAYHWRLLALCGFGWMSDNSALQCIAVILPRVQVHFDLTSKVVGLLSASTMAGMMIGAIGWGTLSDMLGRALPFNATLFLTAVFGLGASYAPSFGILCIWMFFLGSAVGGSMPTDGTLFLENLPHSKQYLLTLLSVFFSLGAVLSSVVSYIFLPGHSCREFEGCDIAGKANDGWRKVLFVLGLFNLACSFARWGLFRLHESPRYLVSTGRSQEAVVVLKAIANYNDQPIDISHEDVQAPEERTSEAKDDDVELGVGVIGVKSELHNSGLLTPGSAERSPLPRYEVDEAGGKRYDSVGVGLPPAPRRHPIRTGSAFYAETPGGVTLEEEEGNAFDQEFARVRSGDEGAEEDEEGLMGKRFPRKPSRDIDEGNEKAGVIGGLVKWKKQMAKLFVPKWRRTVILMWMIWGSMSFSYTMFNVWLPAVLESRATGEGDEAIREALSEFVLYSLAGCPGSIVGAWMIQTRLGRRKSLAICTIATAISTFAFIRVRSTFAVVVSSMIISAAATAMYAVLYGMTPETFGTSIRGTACGTSAALSRLTGVLAPVTAGVLLSISPSLPVFTAAAIFVGTAACSLLLPFERVAGRGGAVMAH